MIINSSLDLLLAALAGIAAGAVNSLAGGGTLITFPMLTFLGIPPIAANVTNTVALATGHFGAVYAQLNNMRGQTNRLWMVLPASVIGGLLGGYILLRTEEKLFSDLVPFLILLASGLLAIQDSVREWLTRRMGDQTEVRLEAWTWLPVGLSAVYGGYFGAGMGVMIQAGLGLTLNDSFTRLNALKQVISFIVNTTATIYFLFSGQVVWNFAIVTAIGAVIGGLLGGRLANRIKPTSLRWTVVVIGVLISIIYFLRG